MADEVDYAALETMLKAAKATDIGTTAYTVAWHAFRVALLGVAPALITKAKEADELRVVNVLLGKELKAASSGVALLDKIDSLRSLLAKAGEVLDGYLCDCPTVCVPPCSDAAARSVRDEIKDALK